MDCCALISRLYDLDAPATVSGFAVRLAGYAVQSGRDQIAGSFSRIARLLSMARNTVAKHLAWLADAGLIEMEREGAVLWITLLPHGDSRVKTPAQNLNAENAPSLLSSTFKSKEADKVATLRALDQKTVDPPKAPVVVTESNKGRISDRIRYALEKLRIPADSVRERQAVARISILAEIYGDSWFDSCLQDSRDDQVRTPVAYFRHLAKGRSGDSAAEFGRRMASVRVPACLYPKTDIGDSGLNLGSLSDIVKSGVSAPASREQICRDLARMADKDRRIAQ